MDGPLIHIAYADDHAVVRKGIISLLNHLGGISVDIEASNGKELIQKLQAAEELPSICILDINMPEMNGFDAMVEIKKRWPRMRFLIVTIFDSEFYIIRMIRNGANGYLLKNCDPSEIKNALFAIERKGVYHSDLVTSQFNSAIKNNHIKLPQLTEMELQLLKYSCGDMTYAEIAKKMKTSPRSIEGYRDSLFRKLQVNSRVSLALFAVQFGLVPLEISTTPNF